MWIKDLGGIYVVHVIALLITSFLGGQEKKATTPRFGVTLQSVPVSIFNTEKYTNLFMLSFFFPRYRGCTAIYSFPKQKKVL